MSQIRLENLQTESFSENDPDLLGSLDDKEAVAKGRGWVVRKTEAITDM